MTKIIVITIGFDDFAVSVKDAGRLLKIASRARRVRFVSGYSGPMVLEAEQRPFGGMVQIQELAPQGGHSPEADEGDLAAVADPDDETLA